MSVATAEQKQLFINNEWRAASSGRTMDVVNPATEEVCATVASADADDLNAAVEAARAALLGPWGQMSARERGRLVRRLGERLMERADEIARLVSAIFSEAIPFLTGETIYVDGGHGIAH